MKQAHLGILALSLVWAHVAHSHSVVQPIKWNCTYQQTGDKVLLEGWTGVNSQFRLLVAAPRLNKVSQVRTEKYVLNYRFTPANKTELMVRGKLVEVDRNGYERRSDVLNCYAKGIRF